MSDSGADFVELMAQLIARIDGDAVAGDRHYIQAFAKAGEILAFRLLQPALKAKFGWQKFGPNELDLVHQALADRT